MPRVLIAGATGYLCGFLLAEGKKRGHTVRALTRSEPRLSHAAAYVDEVFVGEVTRPETLEGLARDVDVGVGVIIAPTADARFAGRRYREAEARHLTSLHEDLVERRPSNAWSSCGPVPPVCSRAPDTACCRGDRRGGDTGIDLYHRIRPSSTGVPIWAFPFIPMIHREA